MPAQRIAEPAADTPQFDSEALWASLEGTDWRDAKVLIVRGDGGREWLAEKLRAQGAKVSTVAAYQRAAPSFTPPQLALLAHALAEPQTHLWLFSSSEAVSHLADALSDVDLARAWAIATHPRIAARAQELGFGNVVKTRPALDAVAACIKLTLEAPHDLDDLTSPRPHGGSRDRADTPLDAAPGGASAPRLPPWRRWRWASRWCSARPVCGARGMSASATPRSSANWCSPAGKRGPGHRGAHARAAGQEGMLAGAAKVALLEARLAEVAVQRGQLEELLQSLTRSRDENMIVDIEAAIRVAVQQNAITGSAEPLVSALKQSDERLSRHGQPKFEGVRRAIARDLDRVRAAGVADVSSLTIRLDEAMRMVDELPLLSSLDSRRARRRRPRRPRRAAAPRCRAAAAPRSRFARPGRALGAAWEAAWERIAAEARSLVRVTRIEHADAMLLAPEQAFFLKENLKLRLLNARLALLSRQFETAQTDLASARASLERFFDRGSRRTRSLA